MSNPLQNRPEDQRRSTEEKAHAIYDLVGILLNALLSIFGKRKSDQ
jgi:hypothetical protein